MIRLTKLCKFLFFSRFFTPAFRFGRKGAKITGTFLLHLPHVWVKTNQPEPNKTTRSLQVENKKKNANWKIKYTQGGFGKFREIDPISIDLIWNFPWNGFEKFVPVPSGFSDVRMRRKGSCQIGWLSKTMNRFNRIICGETDKIIGTLISALILFLQYSCTIFSTMCVPSVQPNL